MVRTDDPAFIGSSSNTAPIAANDSGTTNEDTAFDISVLANDSDPDAGDVLTVHSMLITDEGGYEMQVYARELIGDRMNLTYSRVRDGEVLRTVTGVLTRVPR